jgi:hypothetical protein
MVGEIDPSVLQQRLTEAQAALHSLIIGGGTVTVSYNGESVSFRSADEGKLRRYIAELTAQLNGRCGPYRRGVIA